MSNHVTEWLSAYHDDELKGKRRRQVTDHLAGCEVCRAELESLQSLSALLHEATAAEFVSHERFVSQVNLRLPERRSAPVRNDAVEIGWWMVPVGLIMAWIFVGTTLFLSDMISAANTFGLLDSGNALPVAVSSGNASWASALGQIGLLQGQGLGWAETTERFTRNVLPQFIWQASIALMYLAWIAVWWARRMHPEQAPFIGR